MHRIITTTGAKLATTLLGCFLLLRLACPAFAATPELARILPRGIQRGAEADLILQGQRLDDAKELFIYTPGITVLSLDAKKPNELHAHVRVEKDAHLGEYLMRVRCESGISELRTLQVTPFPVIEVQPQKDAKGRPVPGDFEHPQQIDPNVTIVGTIGNEQVQYFAIDMKKGQRLNAEVHGMRLGELFDPYIAILDEKRFELAVSDDTALAMQDPIASLIVPADGRYIILLRESSYGQGSHYLLHVGTYPRPRIIYPLGGRPGENLAVHYLGDVAGPFAQSVKLPDHPVESLNLFPEQDGLAAPSPNFLRVSDMPNVLEKEPNDDLASATAYSGELPVAFNGIIEKPGDVDYFRFTARKGQSLELKVFARQLRSPLDSVLTLYNAKGNVMASNDDSGGPDSYLRFDVPADGEYSLAITDQLHQGGLDYAYRIEVAPVKTDLVFSIPMIQQNSQERWTAPVPRGNRYATLMRAQRTNFGGDVSLSMSGLPDGVTMSAPNVSDSDLVPVLFEARADAPIVGKLAELTGKSADEKARIDVAGRYEQRIELVHVNNNQPLYTTKINTLAVAVTQEAPFKLHLEQPRVPLVQGGEMQLKISAERSGDFKGPIDVRMLFTPPNLGAISSVEMPGDKSEILYPMTAQMNAAPRSWKICVVGRADVKGELWVASELVDLSVAEPYLLAKVQMTAAEQGKPAQVLCKLEQKQPFEGKAKARLLGLPPNATCDEVEISSADQQVIFPVSIGEKTPPGSHAGLFARVTVMKDGQEIVHNVGRGGVLRVDKVAAPKPDAPVVVAKPVEKKPAMDTPKVLSRLEKLREEQAAAQK